MDGEWPGNTAEATMETPGSKPAHEGDEWSSLLNASDGQVQDTEQKEDGLQPELQEAQHELDASATTMPSEEVMRAEQSALPSSSEELPTAVTAVKNAAGHGREESFSRSRASVGLSLADVIDDEEMPMDSPEPAGPALSGSPDHADGVETHIDVSPEHGPPEPLHSGESQELEREPQLTAPAIETPNEEKAEPPVDDQPAAHDDEWQRALNDGSDPKTAQNDAEDGWARAISGSVDEDVNDKDNALQRPTESTAGEPDEWAKAMGEDAELKPKAKAFDEIFGDGAFLEDEDGLLDDDDFLPDDPVEVPTAPPVSQPQQVPSRPQNAFPQNSYTTNAAAPPSNIQDAPKVGPMKFFEDLPVTQAVRSRKPRQQIVGGSPAPTPPPQLQRAPSGFQQNPMQPPPHAQQGSIAPNNDYNAGYVGLRQAGRLDPFPPQPSVAPINTPQTLPAYASSPPSSSQHLQQPLQRPAANSRYSPAPTQPTAPANKYATSPNEPPLLESLVAKQQPYAAQSSSYPTPPPSHPTSVPPAPSANSRYSPGPIQQPTRSVSNYTARDQTAGPPRPPSAHKFAPRTSSPLAYHQQRPSAGADLNEPAARSRQYQQEEIERSHEEPVAESPAKKNSPSSSSPASPSRQSAPARRTSYAPVEQSSLAGGPPQLGNRQQTGEGLPSARFAETAGVSASMNSSLEHIQRPPPVSRPSGPSGPIEEVNFVLPEDEQASDPLQRWKGRPIFFWSPSGSVSTSFPKRVPRFGGGNSVPLMKSFPGDIKLQKAKDLIPTFDGLQSFPGPLRTKSKKKEVVAWLSSRIGALEAESQYAQQSLNLDSAGSLRLQERLLLLQLLKIMVDNDGILTGNATVENAVRTVLLAGITTGPGEPTSSPTDAEGEGRNSEIIASLHQQLLQGDREKAVWAAVDGRMWGHALLVSSTMSDKSVWKQVIQEFVRKEVRQSGAGNQSMAALYEIFGGNWDESVDELVPASARAGFQMMSTNDSLSSKQDAREGLNKWRETLALIVNNRSADDENGLIALGKLLSNYERIDAAHICFLFARSLTQVGGADDPKAHFTLLGADAAKHGVYDIENILLSEVYEFAGNLASPSTFHFGPHLQSYKLYHASMLAEYGFRAEAQQYCEAIAAAFKATTKLSPYFHATLISQVDELSKRLSQTPKDGKSGWMSKPSIEKVSGSMWAKFNSFVAGDESEKTSSQNGDQPAGEYGPFAGLTGGTPTISRSGSTTDLGDVQYPPRSSSYPSMANPTNSRYAPGYTSGSSRRDYSPHPLQQTSTHGTPPPPNFNGYGSSPEAASSYGPMVTGSLAPHAHMDHLEVSSTRSYTSSSYEPYVPSMPEEYASSDRPVTQDSAGSSAYRPMSQGDVTQEPQINGYTPSYGGYDPTANGDQPATSGYDPSGGAYEPPTSSYQPYEPPQEQEDSDEDKSKKKKKKTLFDDDDDDGLSAKAASFKRQQRSENDRKAEEAFKKAAEADAARDAQAKSDRRSSSWFGGLFGGGAAKKDPNAPVVHKAKLGEENSFYYDTELKKWVNKKAQPEDASATSAAPTPPPPRAGPPSRHVSGTSVSGPPMGPPSGPPMSRPPMAMGTSPTSNPAFPPSPALAAIGGGPPSRTQTPQSETGSEGPTSAAALGLTLPPSGGPPSRPTTSMSNASSIDDLIGVPAARKSGAAKKGRKGGAARYVDVMGQS